jgi:hypothetical protein
MPAWQSAVAMVAAEKAAFSTGGCNKLEVCLREFRQLEEFNATVCFSKSGNTIAILTGGASMHMGSYCPVNRL